jgi:hypothetical protein
MSIESDLRREQCSRTDGDLEQVGVRFVDGDSGYAPVMAVDGAAVPLVQHFVE